MRRQTVLLLLFPLALDAQQLQRSSASTQSARVLAENAKLRLASSPGKESETAMLPDAPVARGENVNDNVSEVEAVPSAAYRPKRSTPPTPFVEPARVFNKKFLAVHAAYLGSIVYDTEFTHEGLAHHKCVESNPTLGPHPSRGEMYRQNVLAFGGITGLDWLAAKLRIPVLPYITPIAGSAVHFTGGSKWLSECW